MVFVHHIRSSRRPPTSEAASKRLERVGENGADSPEVALIQSGVIFPKHVALECAPLLSGKRPGCRKVAEGDLSLAMVLKRRKISRLTQPGGSPQRPLRAQQRC